MKTTLLPAFILLSGTAFASSHHSVGGKGVPENFPFAGPFFKHIAQLNKNKCLPHLSVLSPEHPLACEQTIDWTEVQPGLSVGITRPVWDRSSRVLVSQVTIKNETGSLVPAGSKLIVSEANAELVNATGKTDDGSFYIETTTPLNSGDSLVINAEFKKHHRFYAQPHHKRGGNRLAFVADFDVLVISNGEVTLTTDANWLLAQVPRTLIAVVSDPDGVSGDISYQWLADGVELDGAIASSYALTDADAGKTLSVNVSYVDDIAFVEEIKSAATAPVVARPVNQVGSVRIDGDRLSGATLHAATNDANGIAQAIAYQWFADGNEIAGATESYLQLPVGEVGQQITVKATYTDFDGYDEIAEATTSHIAHLIVNDEASLISAINTASAGDWIALASGTFNNMAQLDIANGITLTTAQDSNAVISGATCIAMSGDKSALVGLTFNALDVLPGSSCGDNNIYISGDNVTLSESQFLGHVETPAYASEYNYVYVKGTANLIERNLFTGKNLDIKGAAVSIYNKSDGSQSGHVVQYNLFKDMPGTSVQSSAYALQIGRSTGTDSVGEGKHVVRFNRFDNVLADRRLIKVQSSRSSIYNNTIVNSTGGIALEDGYENTAANNIIISAGDNSDDSGISFAPFGHIVTGNYIAGLRTTSSQRAALLLNTETFNNSGNSTLTVSPVVVENNTVINSNNAISTYSGSKCQADVFVANFSNNLVANGVEGQGTHGLDKTAFNNACSVNTLQSTFENEAYYAASADLITLAGGVGEAPVSAASNGLLGADEVGADVASLTLLEETDVGPGSRFTQTIKTTYTGELALDFNNWYVTFPSGDAQYNPQWLVDGNTSPDEFFYDEDGAIVFKTPNIAGVTSSNTKYSRTELREMMRGPEQSPKPSGWPSTKGLNKNNWVFSNSFQRLQHEAGGVDGVLEATLKVDHVSVSHDEGYDYMVGRVIVGQIHASDDEPLRLYYRKDPDNALGSVYFASEVPGIGDDRYEMIGSSDNDQADPIDGIALGEVWSYRVDVKGDNLTITIMREGKPDVTRTVKTAAAYKNDWMYFKAGVYNQNNGGNADDYAQATFYSIKVTHDAPPTEPGDGSDEVGDGSVTDIVDGASLQSAILTASYGDTVEMGDGDYTNMGTIVVTDGVTVTRAQGSNAVISGEFCLQISGDDARVTGLEFTDLVLPTDATNHCRSNGDGNIVISGDNVSFDHNLLNGDAVNSILDATENTHNWLVIKGSNAVVERNTFQNKAGLIEASGAQVRGAYISAFINGSVTDAVIQYNLFKDMLLNNESSAYAIQLGRTTGGDSTESGLHTVQYNRFENIDSKSRLIRVQGSENVISHNTVVDSQGMISLEDGQFNEVNYNVILPSGSDSNDGGIALAPYGHSVVGNYIAGSKTTSSERGGIYLNSNANGSGNQALVASAVVVSANTIINTKQPIHIGSKGCGTGPAFMAHFSDNVVASGVDGLAEEFEGVTVTGKAAVRYSCELDASSVFAGESYFTSLVYDVASTVTTLLPFDSNTGLGLDGEATLAVGSNGLIEATGDIVGKGASADSLLVIDEADVGVDSTTTF